MKKLVLMLAFSALVLAACGGEHDDEESATGTGAGDSAGAVVRTAPGTEGSPGRVDRGPPASARGTARPSISILTPSNGQTVHDGAVTVSVSVRGFKLVKQRIRPPFPPPVAGEGHVHFYLDSETLPTTHSPPTTGTYRSVSGTAYTWSGVGPGRHSFAAQLVGKDHVPLSPPVKDRVTVESLD